MGRKSSSKLVPKTKACLTTTTTTTKGRLEFAHGTYEGELMNGKKHGVGRFVWTQGLLGSYEGEFQHGRMQGEGRRVWKRISIGCAI